MSITQTASLISIITPVNNDRSTLDRAIESICRQTFTDWELLLIDDCSTDNSAVLLEHYAKRDARFRVFRTPEHAGKSVARNLGLQNAKGECICYLDPNDEFYPDYLAVVAKNWNEADVLIFHYDLLFEDAPLDTPLETWSPDNTRNRLFCDSIAALAVAHRRSLIERVGAFNELLWTNEDTELWRRFARSGAEFRFLVHKSGILHDSADRIQSPTPKQRSVLESNIQAHKPLFGDSPRSRPVKKIAFVSTHCVIDYTNGAAVATFAGIKALTAQGFECQAFCATQFDAREAVDINKVMTRLGLKYEIRNARIGPYYGRMIFAMAENLPISLVETVSTRGGWRDVEEIAKVLTACELFLKNFQPDVVWTYGGDPAALSMIELAKRFDIPVVFSLHNFEYNHPLPFQMVDYAVVPSEFARNYYWKTLGLACQRLPNMIDWQRVLVSDRQPRYVTFVNPELVKGVFVFARIAEELARRRPDIHFLVVESRGQPNGLSEIGLDLKKLPNIRWMENTVDPRDFYKLTKMVLLPSLWNENFPLVAAEATLNGIPVLGSSRGGIPEVLGSSGFLFDIPNRYTPHSRMFPTAEEVEPWIETIERLWDDEEFYRQACEASRREAERWRPSQISDVYRKFFSEIFPQPGPPLVPELVPELEELYRLCRSVSEVAMN
jgi:glycosyltransferase involved in cell wall biosynthesis/GT2 family glycosyltransferase